MAEAEGRMSVDSEVDDVEKKPSKKGKKVRAISDKTKIDDNNSDTVENKPFKKGKKKRAVSNKAENNDTVDIEPLEKENNKQAVSNNEDDNDDTVEKKPFKKKKKKKNKQAVSNNTENNVDTVDKKPMKKKKKKKRAVTNNAENDIDKAVMECSAVEDAMEKNNYKYDVYVPGIKMRNNEILVRDESTYVFFSEFKTIRPCLSFDIIQPTTPHKLQCFLTAGDSFCGSKHSISCIKLKMVMTDSFIHHGKQSGIYEKESTKNDSDNDTESDDDKDSDEVESYTNCDITQSSVSFGTEASTNRIRATRLQQEPFIAVWGQNGSVIIFSINNVLNTLDDSKNVLNKTRCPSNTRFTGHTTEGYGMGWSKQEGYLATGDCNGNLYTWKPCSTRWSPSSTSLIGHTDSIEDIQWMPDNNFVFASCSTDKTIRIWDSRLSYAKACTNTLKNAHNSDINVISLNKMDPLLVSGDDEGCLKVWDIRNLSEDSTLAVINHHKQPITTVEWSPHDNSVFASGDDSQIAIWDLSVEKDEKTVETDAGLIPPQLLFIHQGQSEIKELHWNEDIPGMIISTALSGFNAFKTISA